MTSTVWPPTDGQNDPVLMTMTPDRVRRGGSRSTLGGRWIIMAKREVTLAGVSAGLVVGLLAV